jgi:hypothetical protein
MRPVSFHESEVNITAPGDPEIDPLPVVNVSWLSGHVGRISCWELSPSEWAEVAASGRVYLTVWGLVHPPVLLSAFLSDVVGEDSPVLKGTKP